MKIGRNITVNLSEQEVKEIIAAHLRIDGYDVKANDVNFLVGSELVGIGPMEHEITKFKGCEVRCIV